jgi:hypothetical protein
LPWAHRCRHSPACPWQPARTPPQTPARVCKSGL